MIRKSGYRFFEKDHAPPKNMIRKKPAPDLIRGWTPVSEMMALKRTAYFSAVATLL